MRDLLNLIKMLENSQIVEAAGPETSSLKSQIISQIKKTDDSELLQKIYTALNKGNLTDRIGLVLDRDTDTKGYVDQLTNLIIDVPGTYQEKEAFVTQYPTGYIDINRMLSGEYVTFDQLITGGPGAPLAFVHRVFDALKQVTFGGAKGPGEFGLAVLSPHIKITGKGDLNIGNELIEVKANAGQSGGRVGTPGLLKSDNVMNIINKYINFDVGLADGLNLKQLSPLMDGVGLSQGQKTKLAHELFTYIFDGKVDVSGIVHAVVNGGDPNPSYLKANYELYQMDSGFDGMMLMNFPAQALKYFKDPLQMANEIYAFSVYLVSANAGFQSRQILSQVTLKPVKEKTTPPPGATKKDAKLAKATPTANPVAPKQPVRQPVQQPAVAPEQTRLSGPGAKVSRKPVEPQMTTEVLGREKKR